MGCWNFKRIIAYSVAGDKKAMGVEWKNRGDSTLSVQASSMRQDEGE
jgi:hypothetical protein